MENYLKPRTFEVNGTSKWKSFYIAFPSDMGVISLICLIPIGFGIPVAVAFPKILIAFQPRFPFRQKTSVTGCDRLKKRKDLHGLSRLNDRRILTSSIVFPAHRKIKSITPNAFRSTTNHHVSMTNFKRENLKISCRG